MQRKTSAQSLANVCFCGIATTYQTVHATLEYLTRLLQYILVKHLGKVDANTWQIWQRWLADMQNMCEAHPSLQAHFVKMRCACCC